MESHAEVYQPGERRTAARVLLIDDEPGILRMFKTVLVSHGYVTEEAEDGEQGLALLDKESFDVIVSDINMPRQDGLEFLRRVRERDLDVPVIMMTGRPSLGSSSQALEYGAFRYFVKPVMPAVLREAVERAVRLHEVARLKRRALEIVGTEGLWLGDRAALEARFAKALDGIWLAYQPIVSCRERSVYGYEALLRSSEPTLANPPALLDAAERLGKLHELGRAIRGRVVAPPAGIRLFVNLHSADLQDDELYRADSVLARFSDSVVLEITERASLANVTDLDSRIVSLRQLGFKIAIDDLGAGYAGLSSFAKLEPDITKLDMSLVRDVHLHSKRQSIVRSLYRLCTELGITVIAEGVETQAERQTLNELGCDLLQGYLFAKPTPGFPTPAWG